MTEMGLINNQWSLMLTEDRVQFHAARQVQGWERSRLEDCFLRFEPGMIVWDIGAECGDFTALYRQWVGDAGRVVAVEPQPAYWPSIRATWTANNFPEVLGWYCGFASDITDENPPHDKLWRHRRPDRDGWPLASRGPIRPDFGFRHLAQQTDSTPQIRLDDLADRFTPPNVIVMDIEGAEYRALVGAEKLIREHPMLLYVSVHPPTMLEWYGKTLDDLLALMRTYGYEGTYLGQETELFYRFQPYEWTR